ncbi:histone deacetylase family protein [Erythrobacter sp. WG]|uniref:histone deacetylase family protein n=1 Tax=Erythrobacter sp. WG TaxID=2985510 RepID=UPI0022708F91|nr:histone deacetylase family protein [Erythrobacter sp. WG]MCX9146498.1 histone deacetylase family protein [Erythrobacter sp. WG]
MLTFCSPAQTAHAPLRELHNGGWMDHAETPARLETIRAALGPAALRAPADHGLAPILAVHDADYVAFLESAHAEWRAAGREGDAIPYTFPVRGRRPLALERIDAKLGRFSYDAATPVAAGTWGAAYAGAQAALSALEAVAGGEAKRAFALCRPPGHHAGADYFGGYCYLNNAAIAARAAAARGLGPVAVLDVDYHHGNGTQDIFWEDGGVFFASIHADPATDYPYYWGHADERGAGDGEGATMNLPLPRGTTWAGYKGALGTALEAVAAFGARTLIVSYGADTFAEDPISHFALTTDDMNRIGAAVATLGLPTVTVMEGGYDVAALGRNVAAFLAGLEGA